ncbi:MAG: putative rane protein [Candidatus Sulfotelmatobacter sp.]|nr:putative rane protein [Candidatus Sulfotelmatobacter sp.]
MPIIFSLHSAVRYSLSLALLILAMSAASLGQFRVAITFEPPALPVYEQPLCPGEGYIWTPGFWAWDDDAEDYYWVPGTWVLAPEVGFLWTPPWWGWGGEAYVFHEGFWGPTVGFYGGIDYGFGYFGRGYEGGRWENGRFFYNRAVNNVNVTVVHNVYESRVVNENRTTRVSYNGGNGGVNARPTPQEEAAAHARHLPPVPPQIQHIQVARTNPQLRASVNQGRPPIAATPKPGALNDRSAVPARQAGAPYHPPANRGRAAQPRNEPANLSGNNNSRPANNVHVRDLPPAGRPSAPNTGNPRLDQKYQRQQEKLSAQQDKERQKLQQRQEQDHQRMRQQRDAGARTQQLEQRHQQQTQQLQQRHQSQQQQMQQRQQPPSQSGARPPKGKQ